MTGECALDCDHFIVLIFQQVTIIINCTTKEERQERASLGYLGRVRSPASSICGPYEIRLGHQMT